MIRTTVPKTAVYEYSEFDTWEGDVDVRPADGDRSRLVVNSVAEACGEEDFTNGQFGPSVFAANSLHHRRHQQ